MTIKFKAIIKSLVEREFETSETIKVLSANKAIFWSWGAHNFVNFENKALVFKVQGHHHKGYVCITLAWDDTYTVNIITTTGKILNTYKNVYFDQLVEIIDNRIEKIKDYAY
jgi:hypothetical protein